MGDMTISLTTSGIEEETTPTTSQEISVVLAGLSGAGKSNLFTELLGQEVGLVMSSRPITEEAETGTTDVMYATEDFTIKVIDTPGGVVKRKDIQQDFDLLIYCINISPGAKFQDELVLQSLDDVYGEKIWKHCCLVLTFSNLAWDRFNKKLGEENGIPKYKDYLQDFSSAFKVEPWRKSCLSKT